MDVLFTLKNHVRKGHTKLKTEFILHTQPIIFRSDSDLTFFLSDSRLNTDMIQNFWAIT